MYLCSIGLDSSNCLRKESPVTNSQIKNYYFDGGTNNINDDTTFKT